MADRPGEDASPEEIARWMEESFGEALAEGIENAVEGGRDRNAEE